MDIGEFLAMGGYAALRLAGYGLSALVLVWNAWSARRLRRVELAAARRRAATASAAERR